MDKKYLLGILLQKSIEFARQNRKRKKKVLKHLKQNPTEQNIKILNLIKQLDN